MLIYVVGTEFVCNKLLRFKTYSYYASLIKKRKCMINKGTIALGVILGTAIGASLGVLLAPEKGSDTRQKLKDEAKNVKDQLTKDVTEVKEDIVKSAVSGKEALEKNLENFASNASYKTESAITFLEKLLADLKEKNKKLQKTS